MRHRKKFNHLGRKKGHRSAMLANMACSLIEHKRINTTLAKAKALKKFVEPLITKSKSDTTHNRRIVFSRIKQKNAVSELFRDVAVKNEHSHVGDAYGYLVLGGGEHKRMTKRPMTWAKTPIANSDFDVFA